MANNQTDTSNDVNKKAMAGSDEQKKAFEQGNGNNSTTADPKKMNENPGVTQENEKGKQGQGSLNSNDQSKVTNQDSKITNNDESIKKNEMNDDEDVDEDEEDVDEEGVDEEEDVIEKAGETNDYKSKPEMNAPVLDTQKAEKKISNMDK